MAVKGAGRNCYYKKIDATNNEETYYDINPSGVYGDLFEGHITTHVETTNPSTGSFRIFNEVSHSDAIFISMSS